MGLVAIDTEVMALFERATLGKNEQEKAGALQALHARNPGVADIAEVFRQVKQDERVPVVTHQANHERYAALFELAEKWSFKETHAASKADMEYAVHAMRNGDGKDALERALTGVTQTRTTLIAEVSNAYNHHQDEALTKANLARLGKMDPELTARLQGAMQEADASHKIDPVSQVIQDVYHGKYDKYGLSKAAYDFNALAGMDPNSADYKPKFDQAVGENKIIGPYLVAMKGLETRLRADGGLSEADDKTLGMLQRGFASQIRDGKELASVTERAPVPQPELQP
ncbi:hypothetical protein ANRL2_03129 [Anaerolineae bacterium]|nr:hypothetical protein ANRL2_03129 [Anaerolineae bacterium]